MKFKQVAGIALMAVALTGCSTVKGWFAGKDAAAKKALEPAELTKFEASAKVDKGDIELTLAGDLGSGLGGQTVNMELQLGTSSLTWFNSTSVTNPVAKEVITRSNIPKVVATQ